MVTGNPEHINLHRRPKTEIIIVIRWIVPIEVDLPIIRIEVTVRILTGFVFKISQPQPGNSHWLAVSHPLYEDKNRLKRAGF